MSEWSNEKVQEVLEKIYKKAATDAAFREKCLKNPGEAVQEISGVSLPSGFKLRFVDSEGADMTLVLPDLQPAGELTEKDLDEVAGGAYGTKLQCFNGMG